MEKTNELARRSVRKMLDNDPCSRDLGIELVENGPGWAKTRMTVTETMLNGFAICHGGIIFTLADTTFAAACNGYDLVTVALGCDIEFLSSAYLGDVLTAQGRERRRGRTTGLYDIEVYNQDQKLLALFRGKAYVTDKKIL